MDSPEAGNIAGTAPPMALLAGIAVFVVISAMFIWNSCPTVYARDSGELSTAAAVFGIPHPPGYPTYMLFGKAFSMVPLGNPAYRTNLMSAVFASFAVLLVYWTVLELTGNLLAGITAALTLAFSPAFWKLAIVAEVFAPNAAFMAAELWLVFRWFDTKSQRLPLACALLLGFSLGNHQIMLFSVPALVLALWTGRDQGRMNARLMALIAVFGLAGVSVYLLLPIRAMSHPIINGGDPSTLRSFWAVLTRARYGTLKLSKAKSGEDTGLTQLAIYGTALLRQFTPAGLLLAVIGEFNLRRKNFHKDIFLLLSFLAVGPGFVWLAHMPVDIDSVALIERFYTASWCHVAILVGIGAASAASWISRRSAPAAWAALLAIPGWLVYKNFQPISQRSDFAAYDVVRNFYKGMPPGSVFYPVTDTVAHGGLYLEFAEQKRKDVRIIIEDEVPANTYPDIYRPNLPDTPNAGRLLAGLDDPEMRAVVNGNIDTTPIFIEQARPGVVDYIVPEGLLNRLVKNPDTRYKAEAVANSYSLWSSFAERSDYARSSDPFVRQLLIAYYSGHYNSSIVLGLGGFQELSQRERRLAEASDIFKGQNNPYIGLTESIH